MAGRKGLVKFMYFHFLPLALGAKGLILGLKNVERKASGLSAVDREMNSWLLRHLMATDMVFFIRLPLV